MAREKKDESPAYIDYDGYSTSGESYTGADVIERFTTTLRVEKRMSVVVSSLKDRSLAKKIAQEYSPDIIDKMVSYWVTVGAPEKHVHNFSAFYITRHQLASKVQPKDYGW